MFLRSRSVLGVISTELLEKERENYNFRDTYVYRVLNSSSNFLSKYPSPESIYVEPEKFLDLYLGYVKETIESLGDADFWNMVFGYEGSGKSSLSLMLFSLLTNRDLEKLITNSIFLQSEYAKMAYWLSKNQMRKIPLLIDDAHYVFGKYNTLTKETLSILQLARFIRDQQIIHILNTQSPNQLYRDIWFERVVNYIYTFKIKKIISENLSIYRMYGCVYLETGDLKADMDNIRNVANWKYIITKYPPDMITRFDLLFKDFEKEYSEYKKLKNFYKQFYSYFRYKGIVKGEHFEKLMKMLYSIINNEKIEIDKKFIEVGIINKQGELIDKEILKLCEEHKDVIIKRVGILKKRSDN